MLASFNPTPKADGSIDFGLDAIYVWPGGEVWFSTEEDFDSSLGPIGAGDLLSDRGYVIYRNLDLVRKFNPIEDVNSFGLDGLFIVTDTTPPPLPGRFSKITSNELTGKFELEWVGSGRVFQVEKAAAVEGPYAPGTSIIPDLFWTDPRNKYPQLKPFLPLAAVVEFSPSVNNPAFSLKYAVGALVLEHVVLVH